MLLRFVGTHTHLVEVIMIYLFADRLWVNYARSPTAHTGYGCIKNIHCHIITLINKNLTWTKK